MADGKHKWVMVIDIDRCSGCQACVVACQAENNVALNTEEAFLQRRAYEWIRVERYWDGDFPDVKARFIPIPCQHCENAPCEPVCPVFATYHNYEGLNVQVYNRCVGTRFCGNNCPYQVRFFNFWQSVWPESLQSQLNPDVTVRSRGIIEKCSFCVHRLRRAELQIEGHEGGQITDENLRERLYKPACVQACPTGTLVFGDLKDPNSQVSKMQSHRRGYRLLGQLGTAPNVLYLKKVDPEATE